MDERPVGAGRSGWRPDSLGAGGVQCVEHGGDRHPDRTCRAGGGPDVLGRFREHGRRGHRNRSLTGRSHQRRHRHFVRRGSSEFQRHGGSGRGARRVARACGHRAGCGRTCRRPAGVDPGKRYRNARRADFHGRKPAGHREPDRAGHRASRRRDRHRSFDRSGLHLQLGPRTHRPSRPLHVQRGVRGGVLPRNRDHLPRRRRCPETPNSDSRPRSNRKPERA